MARISSLSYKAKNGQVIVIEDFTLEAPKTKEYVAILSNLKIENQKSLMVLPDVNQNIIRSARNIRNAKVVTNNGLITYNILNAKTLVFTESSIKNVESMFNKQ